MQVLGMAATRARGGLGGEGAQCPLLGHTPCFARL